MVIRSKVRPFANHSFRSTRQRKGFMLFELTFVIATIVVLVGIMLPELQEIRLAAARNQSARNLKQLSLACLNYGDSKVTLPGPISMVSPFWRQLVERRASRFQFSSNGNALIADGYEIRYVELDNLEYGLIAVPVEPGLTGSETVLLRGHAAREATDRDLAFIETPGADENRARAMLAIQHCGLQVIADLISKYGDNETVETSVPESAEFSIDAFDALDLNADGKVTPDEIADVERAPIPLDLMACIVRELRLGAGGERVSDLPGVRLRDLQR